MPKKAVAAEPSEEGLHDDVESPEPEEEEDVKPAKVKKAEQLGESPTLVQTEKRFRLFRKTDESEDWFILNDRNQLLASGEKMLDGVQLVRRLATRR